eukprot:tig00020675_g12665.t1
MSKRKDYYKILGVPRDAPVDLIKKTYRKLALKSIARCVEPSPLSAVPPPFAPPFALLCPRPAPPLA